MHTQNSKNLRDDEKYISLCDYYHITVDPSVLVTLSQQLDILQPSNKFESGHLLPLKEILQKNTYIKELILPPPIRNPNMRFQYLGQSNTNVQVLGEILKQNKNIQVLKLQGQDLDHNGMKYLSDGLIKNTTIKKLDISNNKRGNKIFQFIKEIIQKNKSLEYIKIKNNNIGSHRVRDLMNVIAAQKDRNIKLIADGNFVQEELMNSFTHGLGMLLTIFGAVLMLVKVSNNNNRYHTFACALYLFSLFCLYTSSTLYHGFFQFNLTKNIFQKLDHCAIYLLISGSYTPIIMISLSQNNKAIAILLVEWIIAFIGMILHLSSNSKQKLTQIIETSLYLIMGWMAVLLWDDMKNAISEMGLNYIVSGGLCYSFGVIFFAIGENKPIGHVIWHIFVMMGSLLQFIAIYVYIL